MSELIKDGDLVAIIRPTPCCGGDASVGRVFTASRLSREPFRCKVCSAVCVAYSVWDGHGDYYLVSRLQRIPDFPELKDERHDETIDLPKFAGELLGYR